MFILRIIHHGYNKLIGFMREYPDEGIAIKMILLGIYSYIICYVIPIFSVNRKVKGGSIMFEMSLSLNNLLMCVAVICLLADVVIAGDVISTLVLSITKSDSKEVKEKYVMFLLNILHHGYSQFIDLLMGER